MQITNSPDITNLLVDVRFDISNPNPVVFVTNESTGSGLANCVWWFVIISPTQTIIHNGSETAPDITGNWATHLFTDAWPRPFNSIEWSGAPYSCQVYVKDSNGLIFINAPQTATICRPAGNTQNSKNTYGLASSIVSVKCQDARIYFQDTTYHSYKGDDGTYVGSILNVIYPIDETGNIPDKFTISNYTTALVPISYSSTNYQFLQQDYYDYDLGNNTSVRIRYQTIQTFAVWCNIDLMPLVCEFNKLIDSVQYGTCSDVQEAQNKISLISPKMSLVFMGIMQPLTGIDVPALIEQIKVIGGFDCECCSAATGIIPVTSSVIDGYNFSVNPVCGDISGTVTNDGTNIVFNLQDVSYIVTVCNESPSETTAFSFVPSVAGCQKTYCLKIDARQLSFDILTVIKNDSSLVNLFNSIVNNGGDGSFNLLVDGKCIFQTTNSCNYTFGLLNIPPNTTFAILTSIPVNGTIHVVNFAFNESNTAPLQAYLNTLGFGIFTVTDLGAGQITISSNNNTNNIGTIGYTVSGVNYLSNLTKNCTGYLPISANEVVQNIINYLCDITDVDIETSQDYAICYVDPITKTKAIVTVNGGAALADFISELLARNCNTIDYILGLSTATCTGMKNLFPPSIVPIQSNDIILGTKGGACASISPSELATIIFNTAITDSSVLSSLCAAVAACGAGVPCTPFNIFYLTVPYSSPTDNTMDIIVTFSNPSAASFNLRYARIDNTETPTYISVPGILSSPYLIDNVPDGQYIVGLTPIYSDGRNCPEVTQTTTGCTGINSFSAVIGGSPSGFVISYNASAAIPKVRVNISYPNGGSFSQIYTNNGVDIDIPFPVNVFGDFSISMTPVCNETTGFFGAPTAPVIVNVPGSATGTWTIFYTNNNPVVPLQIQYGNNGSSPSNTLYSGNYTSDPLSGSSALLPAVNANVVFFVGAGKTISAININGVNGTTGMSTSTFTGVNGNIVIHVTTT